MDERCWPDIAESLRRERLVELNVRPADRETLEARHGQVWDIHQLARDFVVVGFMAPFVVVRRKTDGVLGSCEFQHNPRLYFNWMED